MFTKLFFVLCLALLLNVSGVFAQTGASGSTVTVETAYGVAGQSFVLDGSRSTDDGTVSTYSWEQVSGPHKFTSSSGAKISVTPPSAGTYEFELFVTDRAGTREVIKKIKLIVSAPTQSNTGGTEDINIGIGEQQAPQASSSPKPSGSKGNVEFEWKVEEGEKLEGSDDRLINAGPKDGWPSGGITVSAGDINGLTDEEKTQRLTAVKAWAELQSGQDLKNFATGVLLKDVQMKGVKIMENLIEVDYEMPGKLLGFIPVGYSVRVSVNLGDNENWDFARTKIKFPWYSFLIRKGLTADEINAALEQEGKVNIAVGDINGDGFDAAAQAITLVSNVLKTKHDTVKNSVGNIR